MDDANNQSIQKGRIQNIEGSLRSLLEFRESTSVDHNRSTTNQESDFSEEAAATLFLSLLAFSVALEAGSQRECDLVIYVHEFKFNIIEA